MRQRWQINSFRYRLSECNLFKEMQFCRFKNCRSVIMPFAEFFQYWNAWVISFSILYKIFLRNITSASSQPAVRQGNPINCVSSHAFSIPVTSRSALRNYFRGPAWLQEGNDWIKTVNLESGFWYIAVMF